MEISGAMTTHRAHGTYKTRPVAHVITIQIIYENDTSKHIFYLYRLVVVQKLASVSRI